MGCTPMDQYCTGDGIIACDCPCERCEEHDLECIGCRNCADGAGVHIWTKGLDPRYLICVVKDCGLVQIAS